MDLTLTPTRNIKQLANNYIYKVVEIYDKPSSTDSEESFQKGFEAKLN